MKGKKYLTILTVICILSYFMMVNSGAVAAAGDKQIYYKFPQESIVKPFIYDYRDAFIREKELASSKKYRPVSFPFSCWSIPIFSRQEA
jgi:hypothetical protein